jgi:hypothetical protein
MQTMIRHLRSFVVSSELLVLERSVVAEDVWWCELDDEQCEFGSVGCTHTRACPVYVAFNSAY